MSKPTKNKGFASEVDELLQLFRSKDVEAIRDFIQRCPPARFKEVAVYAIQDYVSPELMFFTMNRLVENYSRGIAPRLGITLSQAIYLYSQELFAESALNAHLQNAGHAAVNSVIGFNAIGSHERLIAFAKSAEQWLEAQAYFDVTPTLLLSQIEALIDLAQYEKADALLNQTNWQSLLEGNLGERKRQERLLLRVNEALRPATELPTVDLSPSDREFMIEDGRAWLKRFSEMAEIMPPEIAAMMKEFTESPQTQEELEKDLPNDIAEWAVENQRRVDHLTDLLSGKPIEDVQRDYLKMIGRPDLIEKLLGETSLSEEETDDSN
jgi:hypothetical protein